MHLVCSSLSAFFPAEMQRIVCARCVGVCVCVRESVWVSLGLITLRSLSQRHLELDLKKKAAIFEPVQVEVGGGELREVNM